MSLSGRATELIWKSDNRSVVRDLRQMREESQKTSRSMSRDSHATKGQMDKMGESAHRVRGAVSGLAGAVGATGLAFGIKDVMRAGMAWQQQQTQLQGALRATGQFSVGTQKDMLDAAERLSQHGGFDAGSNVQSLTLLTTATKSSTKAVRDMGLATDISRRTGKDYSMTVRALMMAEQGRTTGLARLGIAIPKVTTAEDALKKQRFDHARTMLGLTASGVKLSAATRAQIALNAKISPQELARAKAQDVLATKQSVIATLQQKYSGATDRYSRTSAGRVSNMKNAWEALQKSIGVGLLPVMNKLIGVASAVFGWLNKNRIVLYVVLGVVTSLTLAWAAHGVIMALLRVKTDALAGAQKLLALAMGTSATAEEGATGATIGLSGALTALPIFALVGLIVLAVTHWKQFKQAAVDVWHSITLVARLAVTGIAHAFSALFDILTFPFRKAWQFISGVFSKITSIPGKIGHAAGSLLHTATFGLLATGGQVKPKYLAAGGPSGTDVVPGWLTPGEGVVNTRGMRRLGAAGLDALNAGQGMGGEVTINPLPITITLDGRVLASQLVHFSQMRAARGSSSLVGGGLMTGSA